MPNSGLNRKLPLSVSVIAYNEEENIGRMLDSICDIASEIVIVIDNDSTDATSSIAESYGAKVYREPWKGFTDQKNSSLAKCTLDWVLMLDADEVVSDELKESIITAVTSPDADAYYLTRKTYYLGKLLNYAWQPDKNLRLASIKSKPVWVGGLVHESLNITGSKNTLKGVLIHHSYSDISHHFRKTIDYARICAESYFRSGRKFKKLNLLLNPVIAFIRLYLVNQGYRDGLRGFVAAFSSFVYTFLKYVFLWELYLNNRK